MSDAISLDELDPPAGAAAAPSMNQNEPSPVQLPGSIDLGTVHPEPKPKGRPIALDELDPPGEAAPMPERVGGLARAAELPTKNFAQGFLESLAPFAASAADPSGTGVGAAVDELMNGGKRPTIAEITPELPGAVMAGAKNAGLTPGPELQPENWFENAVASGSRGAGRVAAFAPLAPASAAPMALAAGAGGGMAGDLLETLFPDHPVIAQIIGNAAGSLGTLGTAMVAKVAGRLPTQAAMRAFVPGAVDSQAAQRLAHAMQQDIDSGAVTAKDFAEAGEKGIMPWEVENAENTRALAGSVTRSGGPARTTMRAYAKSEDAAAPARLEDALGHALGTGDVRASAKQLEADQAAAAKPAYKKAMAGGSIAPLRVQLRDELQALTAEKGNVVKAIKAIEREKPGALAARGAAGRETREHYAELIKERDAIEGRRKSVLKMFEQARDDVMNNKPGAVWTPRIQEFLDDPIMRAGLTRGMEDERIEAVADGRVFNPTEYAITGVSKTGEPIVARVPNMRLLDMGKRGLDSIIAKERDPITGKLSNHGRVVAKFREKYVKELDRQNSDYKPARDAYAGPARILDAIEQGKRLFNMSRGDLHDYLAELSPEEAKFFRLSAVQNSILKQMNGGTIGANEAQRLLANTVEKLKPQIEELFPDEASRNEVLAAAQKAQLKKQGSNAISGNSASIERAMDQMAHNGGEEGGNVVRGAVAIGSIAGGEKYFGMTQLMKIFADVLHQRMTVSPAVNASMARMLTSNDPAVRAAAMARLRPPGTPSKRLPIVPIAGSTIASGQSGP